MADIKNILCAVDFSEMSPKVASYAHTLAKSLEASVHVVFVASGFERHGGFDVPVSSFQEIIDKVMADAEKKMNSFIQEHLGTVNARGKILKGYADEEILKYAGQENIDLIIMGTHGRKGADRLFMGSIAEKVVKSSKIPVITIRT